MSETHTDITPTSYQEYETLALLAIDFFSPFTNEKYRSILGLEPCENQVLPLSSFDYYTYLRIQDPSFEGKIFKVRDTLRLMEQTGILTLEGKTRSVLLGNSYYALKQITTCQNRNALWLGETFGIGFLQYKLEPNVVQITGKNDKGDYGTGTGFLITGNAVLTCKHVVEDMTPDPELTINGIQYTFTSYSCKEKDLAVLILDRLVEGDYSFPAFNTASILDDVLVMGYPPIPGAKDAYMLSQKGEVNAVVYDYLSKTKSIVLSSVTRPGNSGGPVISRDGYFVGMVTQFSVTGETIGDNQETKKDQEKIDRFPFYKAMDGKEVFEGIKELIPEIEICFENYQ